MKGYKAFKKGLICRDKQYAENTVFEEENAKICESGMHFCENPFDVLNYYPLIDNDGSMTEFAKVEALDKCETDDNKKYCTKKLKIGAKLSFSGFIKVCVNFVLEKTVGEDSKTARIGSSGYSARIGSSGYSAQIGSSGDSAQIGSSGDFAQIYSAGNDSVICCAGNGSIVKAKKGSWITLAEWSYSEKKGRFIPLCVKTSYVDGKTIKEDTYYKLKNGELVEVE